MQTFSYGSYFQYIFVLKHLEDNERPKGVCGAFIKRNGHKYEEGLLAMIAKVTKSDNMFLPSSPFAEYDIKLKYIALPGSVFFNII